MATINDIAEKLGISKSTVSKGLNNATDISEKMRQKIQETAIELGYNYKRSQKRNKKLCILVENMNYDTPNQFGHDIILGFRQMAEPDGWNVDVLPLTEEIQKNTPYDIFMMEYNYQAAFILGMSLPDPWMTQFHSTQIPTVLYDNCIKNNPYVASIGCNNHESFELAVKYLYDLGHRKIALLSGPLDSHIMKARYNAYINAMNKYDLEINSNYIGLDYYVSESVRTYIPLFVNYGVTAILCSHDIRAISALTECNDMGLQVPQDISIIGFDDLPMTAYTTPALTTIRQDRISLGKCGYYAVSCLLNDLSIESIQLRAPLIVRDSTGPVKKSTTSSEK